MTEKITRTFYLPLDIVEMLKKEENQSALITDLLRKYYGMNTEKQEVKQELEDLDKRQSALRAKLDRIEEHEDQRDLEFYEFADYYSMRRDEWSEEREEEWLQESAENLGMAVDVLKDELQSMIGNGDDPDTGGGE